MHTDNPTSSDLDRLVAAGEAEASCVSIYLPTSPVTREAAGDRIAFGNAISEATGQMEAAGIHRKVIESIREALEELSDDDDFWAQQANSLAVFAQPSHLYTYRLGNELPSSVTVSNQFAIKPLLRASTFPQAAFVLALAHGSVRLLEINADLPTFEVSVPALPSDAASAAGKASLGDRSPSGRIQGGEGLKLRLRQYSRKIDTALRDVLAGRNLPLILASTPPLDSIFPTVNSYPHLEEMTIRGNPEEMNDAELTQEARKVLDSFYARQLEEVRELFHEREAQGRSTGDIVQVARAASFGAVDTLLVDMEAVVPGSLSEEGVLSLDEDGSPGHSVTDEIVRRTLRAGGRVLAVREDDLPARSPAAAILRYAI